MKKREALEKIKQIKVNVKTAMQICFDLYRGKAHLAFGHSCFKDLIRTEVPGMSYHSAIKLKESAKVQRVVCPHIPLGELPESIFRPMYKLNDKNKKRVWMKTIKRCGHFKKVTAVNIKETIEILNLNGKEPHSAENNSENMKISEGLIATIADQAFSEIKSNNDAEKSKKVSKSQYNAAINILTKDLQKSLKNKYTELYG